MDHHLPSSLLNPMNVSVSHRLAHHHLPPSLTSRHHLQLHQHQYLYHRNSLLHPRSLHPPSSLSVMLSCLIHHIVGGGDEAMRWR
ncbi:hypothetical protein HanRHA438_Chr08g0348191 [Helianthus annuus]|nr:hypothetical protein HanRHA438_Chr08g0348191 [Helianthus annuus]